MVAPLWHQLSGTKVRLLVGLLAGVLRGGSSGLAEERMHTTTRLWCKPIVVRVQNTTRSGCKLIVVRASTNSAHYYLPTVGVVAHTAEAVASLCGRTCAFSRHSFR